MRFRIVVVTSSAESFLARIRSAISDAERKQMSSPGSSCRDARGFSPALAGDTSAELMRVAANAAHIPNFSSLADPDPPL